jgi:hypothetical protein
MSSCSCGTSGSCNCAGRKSGSSATTRWHPLYATSLMDSGSWESSNPATWSQRWIFTWDLWACPTGSASLNQAGRVLICRPRRG